MTSGPVSRKSNKDDENDIIGEISKDTKGFINSILGDVSKSSATKQLLIGTSTGWATGIVAMKVGKVAAIALGGGIILLQVANHAGYIKVNWDKFYKQIDKVSDKIEEKATGSGPKWMEKVERYVDRKIDVAEDKLKQKEIKAKRWYSNFVGDKSFRVEDVHIFVASFFAGFALGVATS